MKSSPCRTHNTHGCICMWSTAGIAIGGGAAMDSANIDRQAITAKAAELFDKWYDRTEAQERPANPSAMDAITDDEKSLIAMAIDSVQRPRRAVTQDVQFVDAFGNNVDHEFLTFDSKTIVTKPPRYKPVKALPKVRR
jgi:hypothetical protein